MSKRADEPMSTPEALNILRITSWHRLLCTSRFVTAKTRNSVPCSWRQTGQQADRRGIGIHPPERDEADLLLAFHLVCLNDFRVVRVPFWHELVREEYDRVSAHPRAHLVLACYIPQWLTPPYKTRAAYLKHKGRVLHRSSRPRR